jgi:hypothetical protein
MQKLIERTTKEVIVFMICEYWGPVFQALRQRQKGGTPPAQREPIRMAGETRRMSVRFVHKVSL